MNTKSISFRGLGPFAGILATIFAAWSIAVIPLSLSHPVVMGAGALLLVVIVMRPHYGALVMVATFWLSTLFPDEGGLTLNRIVGLITLAGIVLPWIMTRKGKTILVFKKFDFLIFGFLGIVFLSVAINGVYPRTVGYIWELLMGYLLYWLIRNTIDSRNRLRTILWVIVACNAVVAISVVNAFVTASSHEGLQRYRGLREENITGIFGAVAILIVLWLLHQSRKSRSRFDILKYGLVLLFSGAMLLTGSRAWLFALSLSLLVVALFSQERKAKLKPAIVVGLVIVSVFVVVSVAPATVERVLSAPKALFQRVNIGDIDVDRLYLNQGAWRMFTTHPILGVGFGGFGYQLGRYVPQLNDSTRITHNIYTGTLAETGIVGFLMLLAILGSQFSNLWKYIRGNPVQKENKVNVVYALSLLTGVSVNALFQGVIIDKLFFIVFALGTVVLQLLENEPKDAFLPQSSKNGAPLIKGVSQK